MTRTLLFFRYSIIFLIIYNILILLILFLPSLTIKKKLWKYTLYDYKYLTGYPTNLNKLSLLDKSNINKINELIELNEKKKFLDVEYWNYKLILNKFKNNNINNMEDSFIKTLILSKNNNLKLEDLKIFYVKNYLLFSESNKIYIGELFKKSN